MFESPQHSPVESQQPGKCNKFNDKKKKCRMKGSKCLEIKKIP
jgi:hypothetical protein